MGIVEDYGQWLEQVPVSIRQDQLWKFEVYRKAFFLTGLIPAINYHRRQKE